MTEEMSQVHSVADVLDALMHETGVLAVISGIEGPSYRPLGEMMAVLAADRWVGSLSSGCVEADIALQAMEALDAGAPRTLRYGKGSPFIDIQLPCGGGLEILLVPSPDRAVLAEARKAYGARRDVTLAIDAASGRMWLEAGPQPPSDLGRVQARLEPEMRFLVLGKGPEASAFAALVQSVGYPNVLLSPDAEACAAAERAGCDARMLPSAGFPSDLAVDTRTAVVLFFHDHDWEPPILSGALATDAFYIGAQGSWAAREARLAALHAMGHSEEETARLHGPVGLIPSVRDPRTLAVSVLAEVLGEARATKR